MASPKKSAASDTAQANGAHAPPPFTKDQELKALRDGFRAGIPAHWGNDERREAQALYALFAKVGGKTLVGSSPTLEPGTFLAEVRY